MRLAILVTLLAPLGVSHVVAADDLAMPRTEPASVPADDNYTNIRTTLGATVFGGAYAASIVTAAATDHPGADQLYIPVAGPWLALNDWSNCPVAQSLCHESASEKLMLVADGIVQAGGLVAMLDGLLAPNRGHHTLVADKALHLAPSHNGILVWAHF